MLFKNLYIRPREMAQQIKALVVLAEDLDSNPSNHMASDAIFCPLQAVMS